MSRLITGLITGLLVRLLLAAGLGLATLVAVAATPAYACSCIQVDTATSAKLADRVFTGTVEQRAGGDSRVGTVRYDVAVTSVHKGEVADRVEVDTPASGTACGLPDLPEGTELVWFAAERNPAGGRPAEDSGTGRPRLFVSSCDPNGPATPSVLDQVAGALGKARPPAGGPPSPEPGGPSPTASPSGLPGPAEEARDAQERPDGGAPVWPWVAGAGVALVAAGAYLVARRRTG
jgi:hypothetical protein